MSLAQLSPSTAPQGVTTVAYAFASLGYRSDALLEALWRGIDGAPGASRAVCRSDCSQFLAVLC